jgi:hypothetical protein
MIPMKFASMSRSDGSSFDPANPGAIGAGTPSTGAFTRLTVAQGTLTDPVTGLSLTATWNDAADTFHLDDADVTDTASSAASTLLRRRVGGVTMFELRKNGRISGSSFTGPTFAALGIDGGMGFRSNFPTFWAAGINMAEFTSAEFRLGSDIFVSWTPTSNPAQTSDLIIRRGGSATLQLGLNHATTPTAQRIQAHGVTTGTGAPITIAGGSGSAGQGPVNLEGGQYNIDLTGLPTSDPGIPGRLWRSGTNLHIST